MKKTKVFQVIAISMICCLCSCGSCRGCGKDFSSEFGGLERRVTIYANDGSVIEAWEGDIFVEAVESDGLGFLTEDNKRIIINGTYIIEEL